MSNVYLDSIWSEQLPKSLVPSASSGIKLVSQSEILQTFMLTLGRYECDCLDGILHALDPDTGKEVWQFDTGSPILSVNSHERENTEFAFDIDFDSRDFLFQKYTGKSLM